MPIRTAADDYILLHLSSFWGEEIIAYLNCVQFTRNIKLYFCFFGKNELVVRKPDNETCNQQRHITVLASTQSDGAFVILLSRK